MLNAGKVCVVLVVKHLCSTRATFEHWYRPAGGSETSSDADHRFRHCHMRDAISPSSLMVDPFCVRSYETGYKMHAGRAPALLCAADAIGVLS